MVGKLSLFIVGVMVFQVTQTKVVLFFGDSLTAGYGVSPEEFPVRLRRDLEVDALDGAEPDERILLDSRDRERTE